MTDLQLELTRLIGSKELTFGCLVEVTNIFCRLSESMLNRLTSKYGKCLTQKDVDNAVEDDEIEGRW